MRTLPRTLSRLALLLAVLVTPLLLPPLARADCPTGTFDLDQNGACGTPVDLFLGRRIGTGTVTFDVANATIACEDSAAITVTGALTGDACIVAVPTAALTGATHSTWSCIITAADTVKVRHWPSGTASNPTSATYIVQVQRLVP